MARSRHELPDMRASVPTLEPDDAFLARLSELAAGSGTSRPPAGVPSLPGWRVGLAAASVAAVVSGGAWLATAVTGEDAPSPPSRTPATQPTDPAPSESDGVPTGGRDSGAGPGQNSELGGSNPGGVSGHAGGPAPGAGGESQDDPPAVDGQLGQGQGPQGNNGQDDSGQDNSQGNGQAGIDHGQQDGQGDEVHGQDGQPHGHAGDPPGQDEELPGQGPKAAGADRGMGGR